MEDQHMTQQVFADFLQQSPATLSSIFNGRTRPTLNIVDAIKMKIPNINVEWLLYGTGNMYITHSSTSEEEKMENPAGQQDLVLDFEHPDPISPNPVQNATSPAPFPQGVRNTRIEYPMEEVKTIEKEPRHVTEIRVYYDDQTYETFIPSKK